MCYHLDETYVERTENSGRVENKQESSNTCQESHHFSLEEMLDTMPNLELVPANSCREEDTLLNPNQPVNFAYPKRVDGKRERSFQVSWYERFKWLHYKASEDAVLCFIWMHAYHHHMLSGVNTDEAFVKTGYHNWKKL